MNDMTTRTKAPIVVDPKFQGSLLIFIAGLGVTLVIKVFSFSSEIARTAENHEQRIHSVEVRQDGFDRWKEAMTENQYFNRQGKTQIP